MFRKIHKLFSKLVGSKVTHNRRTEESIEVKNENLEEQSKIDNLPSELLELIFKRLSAYNYVHASLVCKKWHSVVASVRVLHYLPWLMYYSIYKEEYEFYDPLYHSTHYVDFPELSKSKICYSKDGWLLIYRAESQQLFFFNPFTREMINLPRFDQTCYLAAFSCEPTSSKCVLFIISYVSTSAVTISTCYPGSRKWATGNYKNQLPLSFSTIIWNTVVFCNGLFYCLSYDNLLAMFDAAERTWTVLSVPLPKWPKKIFPHRSGDFFFMTEQDGEVIVISQRFNANPIVFKLDQTLMKWKVTKTLDGGTLFAGYMSSGSRTGLPRCMRNRVYFPVYSKRSRSTVSFSLKDSKFTPHTDWFPLYLILRLDDIIWVDPPKDFSGFR